MKFTLTGHPKTTNHLYKSACRGRFPTVYMTKDGKELKEAYQWEARAQYRGKPLTNRLEITVTLFFGRKGKKDWDNFHKLSMDALSGIVWEDDEQIVIAHVYKQ